MKNILNTDLYLGNMYDYENIRDSKKWSVVHCCKEPYHKELVGYKGNLSKDNPNYAYCIAGNRMALNIVDSEIFQPDYLMFNYKMFMKAFEFISNELRHNQKVLIHCNEGLSRSPMILLLYLAYKNVNHYAEMDFDSAITRFIRENSYTISPRKNIYMTATKLWDVITN